MKPPCEIVVQTVLPGIRALIAKELLESGLTQEEVAKKLGVTQGAISQYRRELRGKAKILQKDQDVIKEIESFAKKIASGEVNPVGAITELCKICKIVRAKKLICELHKQAFPSLEECDICY